MLKLLEQFPRDTVGVEGTALADALTAQLDELLYFSNAQLFKMGQLQADLPNSFVDDLANGMHALGKGAEAVAGKLVELVKTGSAYSKAFAGEVAAGSLAVATLAVEDVLVPAVKTGASLTARGGLAALSFGASEIIPAMDRAEEANRLQMIGEAMKKETMGKPLSRLEQQALDGYRRRQGQ
jgi:phage-related tail protein